MVSRFLFCCRIAPRRERTQWSPAAVEREALPCSVPLPSLCLPANSAPVPCSKPPGMGPFQLCSTIISSSFGIWSRGGGVYTSFSPDSGESGLHPPERLGMGKQRLDQFLASSIRASKAFPNSVSVLAQTVLFLTLSLGAWGLGGSAEGVSPRSDNQLGSSSMPRLFWSHAPRCCFPHLGTLDFLLCEMNLAPHPVLP